ncbi:MAG: DNA (cytosine-5-)-methyltransferase [Alphaproteobacteria bacterium]|nr:DNA (cytosine-5-)-methyltransferase [Alphaproteobacteria bacterium]
MHKIRNEANFGIRPAGDISKIKPSDVPGHDILFAGFPCQPFSIIGKQDGFADPRGTLFFELLEIIKEKMPVGFVLENVKQLATSDKGRVIERILSDLREQGYEVDYKILNALDFGVPQKRERTIIVGSLVGLGDFEWPEGGIPMKPLSEILDPKPDEKFFVSERIRKKRIAAHKPKVTPSIWHENKSGNISSYPHSCALRAGASYNYLLVNGERRLTPRETLRLQGFSDSYKIVCTDSQVKKQTGNAVAVPVVQAVIGRLKDVVERCEIMGNREKTA